LCDPNVGAAAQRRLHSAAPERGGVWVGVGSLTKVALRSRLVSFRQFSSRWHDRLPPFSAPCVVSGRASSAPHPPSSSPSNRNNPKRYAMRQVLVVVLLAALALPAAVYAATASRSQIPLGTLIVPYGRGTWSYLEGKAPLPAWKTVGFDSSSWKVSRLHNVRACRAGGVGWVVAWGASVRRDPVLSHATNSTRVGAPKLRPPPHSPTPATPWCPLVVRHIWVVRGWLLGLPTVPAAPAGEGGGGGKQFQPTATFTPRVACPLRPSPSCGSEPGTDASCAIVMVPLVPSHRRGGHPLGTAP
jgi:hypothetical protein